MALFPGRMVWASGASEVEVSPEFAAVFERALAAAAPETIAELTRATEEVYENARAEWPRGPHSRLYTTGKRAAHSRDQITRGVRIESGGREIVGFVRNAARWSWAIKWGVKSFGFRRGAKVGRDLIFKPGRKLGPIIARALAKELSDAAVGR